MSSWITDQLRPIEIGVTNRIRTGTGAVTERAAAGEDGSLRRPLTQAAKAGGGRPVTLRLEPACRAGAISTKNKHLLAVYSTPARGVTAAVSVFRGKPPPMQETLTPRTRLRQIFFRENSSHWVGSWSS